MFVVPPDVLGPKNPEGPPAPLPPKPEGPSMDLVKMIKQAILAAQQEEDDEASQDQGALARHTFDTMTAALQKSESFTIKRKKKQ